MDSELFKNKLLKRHKSITIHFFLDENITQTNSTSNYTLKYLLRTSKHKFGILKH